MKIYVAWCATKYNDKEFWPICHPEYVGSSLESVRNWFVRTRKHNYLYVREYEIDKAECNPKFHILSL